MNPFVPFPISLLKKISRPFFGFGEILQKFFPQYNLLLEQTEMQMNADEYLASVENLLKNDMYKKRVWEDPWLILMKGEKTTTRVDDITNRINNLKVSWE